ncbi:MAG TPA: DUF4387 domain-containing protein [bacterium]|nr:DUF4387 domain-containing protein [bacterium]
MARLAELATLIRSKNAGPFTLTIDIMFGDRATYDRVVQSGVLSRARIGSIYHLREEDVKIFPYAPANAIKVTFPRPVASGDLADGDVLAGQQYAPLVDLLVE